MEEIYLNALNLFSYLGPVRINNAINCFKSAKNIWYAPMQKLKKIPGWEKIAEDFSLKRGNIDVEKEWDKLIKNGIKVLINSHPNYPPWLKEIYRPPVLLYVKGELLSEDWYISLVGSRKCTQYGKEIAEWLSYQLSQCGFTVVSGMALGIDTYAHRGALKNGRTVAVLGTGISENYPKQNIKLKDQIIHQGSLISEFPLGTKPLAQNFPQRNRIISGMSMGTVVVEAPEKSGALITADFALEQGREVFAVPGNINSPYSRGCHQLIKQGAKLVGDLQDIFDELTASCLLENNLSANKSSNSSAEDLTAEEKALLNFIPYQALHIDEIIEASGISSAKTGSLLLHLEMKGKITQLPGKYFLRC